MKHLLKTLHTHLKKLNKITNKSPYTSTELLKTNTVQALYTHWSDIKNELTDINRYYNTCSNEEKEHYANKFALLLWRENIIIELLRYLRTTHIDLLASQKPSLQKWVCSLFFCTKPLTLKKSAKYSYKYKNKKIYKSARILLTDVFKNVNVSPLESKYTTHPLPNK